MRWLKYLIPGNVRGNLNSNLAFQLFVTILAFVVGIFLFATGIDAVKTKRFQGRNGQVFEGIAAQICGAYFMILGIAFPIAAIIIQFIL